MFEEERSNNTTSREADTLAEIEDVLSAGKGREEDDRTTREEARRQKAREKWERLLAGLTPESPDEAVQAAWNALHDAGLSTLQRERAEGKMRKALKLLAGEWKKVRAALERNRGREAGQGADTGKSLCPDIPFPDPELAGDGWRYLNVAGRVWVFQGDDRLWTPWNIIGAVTYPDRNGEHGLRVRVADENGGVSEFDIPADVAADKNRLKSALALRGVKMNDLGMERAAGVAAQMGGGAPIRAYGSGGWREPETFLTAWGTAIGKHQNITVAAEARPKGKEVSGTFEGWRTASDAVFATGLPQLQISACAAYASPIVDLIKERSGTLALTGPSGFGKSTGHEAQAATWGDPAPGKGLYSSLNVSAQAPEVIYAQASGSGACGDEVKHYRGSLQDMIFAIAGDMGRQRMRVDTKGLRETRRWGLLVTISYEHPIEHRVRVEDGEEVLVGLGARCLEIPIERIKLKHEVLAPIEGIKTNFGHAGPKFVQALMDKGYAADPQALKDEVNKLADILLTDSQTKERRPAMLMAQIWRGAQIAQDAGLIPDIFPVEPPEHAIGPAPKVDNGKGPQDNTAPVNDAQESERETEERDLPLGPNGKALDSLGQMILLAWRRSREMDSASSDPVAKAIAALLRNLAMGKGVAHHGDSTRGDAHAVRMEAFNGVSGQAVYVIPMAHLSALLDGSADVAAVVSSLWKQGLLLPYDCSEGGRTVQRKKWKHVPGFGAGPAIVIPVAKVTDADEE